MEFFEKNYYDATMNHYLWFSRLTQKLAAEQCH